MCDGFAARILECWVKVVMRLVHILPVHEETEMAVLGSGELAGIFEVPGTRCWYWTRLYEGMNVMLVMAAIGGLLVGSWVLVASQV